MTWFHYLADLALIVCLIWLCLIPVFVVAACLARVFRKQIDWFAYWLWTIND